MLCDVTHGSTRLPHTSSQAPASPEPPQLLVCGYAKEETEARSLAPDALRHHTEIVTTPPTLHAHPSNS